MAEIGLIFAVASKYGVGDDDGNGSLNDSRIARRWYSRYCRQASRKTPVHLHCS